MNEVDKILVEIVTMDPRDTVTVANAAPRLVLAERERCAKLVESPSLRMKAEGCSPQCHAAMAQKIREG